MQNPQQATDIILDFRASSASKVNRRPSSAQRSIVSPRPHSRSGGSSRPSLFNRKNIDMAKLLGRSSIISPGISVGTDAKLALESLSIETKPESTEVDLTAKARLPEARKQLILLHCVLDDMMEDLTINLRSQYGMKWMHASSNKSAQERLLELDNSVIGCEASVDIIMSELAEQSYKKAKRLRFHYGEHLSDIQRIYEERIGQLNEELALSKRKIESLTVERDSYIAIIDKREVSIDNSDQNSLLPQATSENATDELVSAVERMLVTWGKTNRSSKKENDCKEKKKTSENNGNDASAAENIEHLAQLCKSLALQLSNERKVIILLSLVCFAFLKTRLA